MTLTCRDAQRLPFDQPNLSDPLAKPNFGFQKRQREQAKERKKQEKAARKAERAAEQAQEPGVVEAPQADATSSGDQQA